MLVSKIKENEMNRSDAELVAHLAYQAGLRNVRMSGDGEDCRVRAEHNGRTVTFNSREEFESFECESD
jgi:hypothetical protein